MTNCTKPNCNCIDAEIKKQGTELIKSYPCLKSAFGSDEVESKITNNMCEFKDIESLSDEEAKAIARFEDWSYSNTDEDAHFDLAGLIEYIKEIGISSLKPTTIFYLTNRGIIENPSAPTEATEVETQIEKLLSTYDNIIVGDKAYYELKYVVNAVKEWQSQHTAKELAEKDKQIELYEARVKECDEIVTLLSNFIASGIHIENLPPDVRKQILLHAENIG